MPIAAPLSRERPADAAEPREGVHDLYRVRDQAQRAWEVAVGSAGPHAAPYAEMIADGSSDEGDVLIEVLLEDGIVTEAAWAHGDEIPFALIGGLTSEDPEEQTLTIGDRRCSQPSRRT